MLAWMFQVIVWRKLKKSLWLQNFKIYKIFDLTILKNQIFLIKKPFNFLTIERYDIELTNTKIADKNIVPLGGARAPQGKSFLLLFWNFILNFVLFNFVFLISFYNTDFSAIYKTPLWIFKKIQNQDIWLTLESSGHRNSAANFRTVG